MLDVGCRCPSHYHVVPDGHENPGMRTTLNIDGDVLYAVKELAKREQTTTGEFVSGLLREALRARAGSAGPRHSRRDVYGFKPIPSGGEVVTNELVNELRDELGV